MNRRDGALASGPPDQLLSLWGPDQQPSSAGVGGGDAAAEVLPAVSTNAAAAKSGGGGGFRVRSGKCKEGRGGAGAFVSTSRVVFTNPGKPQPRERLGLGKVNNNSSQIPLNPSDTRLFLTTSGDTFRRYNFHTPEPGGGASGKLGNGGKGGKGGGGGDDGVLGFMYVPGMAANPKRFDSTATGRGVVIASP